MMGQSLYVIMAGYVFIKVMQDIEDGGSYDDIAKKDMVCRLV